MNTNIKKELNHILMDEYMTLITNKCLHNFKIYNNTYKIDNDKIIIPTIYNFNEITKYNYNVNQLKLFAKQYNLKISGNKKQLLLRIYSYLYFSSYIIKIQSNFRRILVKKYKYLRGPALIKRTLCNNIDDFITMESLQNIKFDYFFSYTDVDGFIYGFDIISLYNLFLQSKNVKIILNPYNRNVIPDYVFKNVKIILKISKILKKNIKLCYEDDTKLLPIGKIIELRCLNLFQNIDALGNYSNYTWFLSLTKNKLLKFMRELADIWNYRTQIPIEVKRSIYPPSGDLFRNFSMSYILNEENIFNIQIYILEFLEKIINSGIDKDSKTLGAYYVLGALTLVNDSASIALPWLFQSFVYF